MLQDKLEGALYKNWQDASGWLEEVTRSVWGALQGWTGCPREALRDECSGGGGVEFRQRA